MAFMRESPQTPSDTAIDSIALPAVVQVNVAVAAFVGASVPTAGALFVHVNPIVSPGSSSVACTATLIVPPTAAWSAVAVMPVMNGHWSSRPLMATEPVGGIRLHCRMTFAIAVWPATTVNGAMPTQVWPSLAVAFIVTE